MRKSVFLLLLIAIVTCVTTAAYPAEFKKTKVAVVDFQENGAFDVKDVGKIVAEWFTTALVNTGRFDVIERRLLQQILEEQKMGVTGLVDPRSASKLGKILGVKTVVSGTVQSYDGVTEINVRLLNVETGSIITAESFKGGSASSLNKLVHDAATKIVRHFPLQGYVVKRAGEKVTVDLGGTAGARSGMQFKVYVEGAPLKHPKTGEVLSVETVDKGTLRITTLKDKTSDGIIVSETCSACIKPGQLVSALLLEDESDSQLSREEPRPAGNNTEPHITANPDNSRHKLPEDKKSEPEKRALPENAKQLAPAVQGTFRTLAAHKSDVIAMSVSKNGQLAASADKDGQIDIWDLSSWSLLVTLSDPGSTHSVQALAFSDDGKLLATAGKSDKVVIWDMATRRQPQTLPLQDTVTSLAFLPNSSSIAIGTKKARIVVWNFKTSKTITIKTEKDVLALAVSPDGALIASGGQDKHVTLWNSVTGSRIRAMTGHSNDVLSLLFSPGGKQIVSAGSDKKIIVWETGSGARTLEMNGHSDDITALGLSKDGQRLVSSESRRGGGMLIAWDLRHGREQKRIQMSQRAYSMALTPDGRYALTGSDKLVLVYSVE